MRLRNSLIILLLLVSLSSDAREQGDGDGLGEVNLSSEQACRDIGNYIFIIANLRDAKVPKELILNKYDLVVQTTEITQIIRTMIITTYLSKKTPSRLASDFTSACIGSAGKIGVRA